MNSYDTYLKANLNFVNWCCRSVYDRDFEATVFLFSGGIWFQRKEYVKSLNIIFAMLIHELTLRDV
jgi:hypothetical protein